MVQRNTSREYVRTFFTSPTAVEEDDTAKMLRKAGELRGMQAPDVWVPDNEDATAPSMRDEGIENIIDVISEHGQDFPGEIHPRMVWHRDDPETRRQGFEHMMQLAGSDEDVIEHIDGFVIPEVGSLDDWKKADEFITMVEAEHGLEEGSLSMSPIVESGEAEIAMSRLNDEIGKHSNNLERLFLLVDGEVDYTKDMRAMTPTGAQPPWAELRHNTSRAASASGLIAVDGPYDDIRDVKGYRQRMTDNRAKGMLGIWSLTPGQVVEANKAPLPAEEGSYLLEIDGETVELDRVDEGYHEYTGDDVELEELGDGTYRLRIGQDERELDEDELHQELLDQTQYVMSMDDYVDSMEEFEEAKAGGKGAISMTRTATLILDGTEVQVTRDRMWDEATYQAAQTPVSLFQEVYEARPDQQDELEDMYGEDVVDRAMQVG
ncbi:malate synthase AceB [Halomicrococcus sp. NG-SE-24]|uniref:malate synthase AceB n=1 Tax=Halomicrococcus sp. NG-SE-24 TaxID=3436928 RepID=UPI003D987E0B